MTSDMPPSNNVKFQDSDSDLDEDNSEEVEASIFTKVLRGVVALAVIAGLIYVSGVYQYFLYRKIPPWVSQTSIASRVDAEQLRVPLTIFIVLAEEPYGSARSNENAINLVENASRIWDQAGIVLDIKNIYEIERTEVEMGIFYSSPYEFFLNTNKFDSVTINSFLVGNLNGINGVAFGGVRSIAVADYTTVYDFRAFAHEVGHILGLDHASGSRARLMYKGANGFDLSLEEIERARLSAQEFNNDNFVSISIKDTEISVEIADTAEEKRQGLSGRNSLPENRGMLFVHDKPALYSFWMKDMQFPIDIIWIDESYTVIDITKSVPPDSFPQTFQPQIPAQYVLEVNGGFSDKNFIEIGDMVSGLGLE